MKKIFLYLFLFSFIFEGFAQSPGFTIKVPRYFVSVKRVIIKNSQYSCQTNWRCGYVSTLSYDVNLTGVSTPISLIKNMNSFIGINNLANKDSLVFIDTLDVIDYKATIKGVRTNFTYGPNNYPMLKEAYDLTARSQFLNVPDTQIVSDSYYTFKQIVETTLNTDYSRTLPSNDSIRIVGTPREQLPNLYSQLLSSDPTEYKWYYAVDNTSSWTYIPSSDTSSLIISGEMLFGNNFTTHLNKTVFVRVLVYKKDYNSGHLTLLDSSNVEPFTLRLSSPKIISTTPHHVTCWGDTTGYFKVTFDRALLPNEKLNFLLKDTTNRIDYNILNVSSLASDNSLTWPVELLGETNYQLGLIGKYIFNNRNEATYTSSPKHFSNFTIFQPDQFKLYTLKERDVLCKTGNSGRADIFGMGGTREYKLAYKYETDTAYTWINLSNPTIYATSNGDSCKYLQGGFKSGKYYYKLRDINNCIIKNNGSEKIDTLSFSEPAEALRFDVLDISPITNSDSSNGAIKIQLLGGTPGAVVDKRYSFNWSNLYSNTQLFNYDSIITASIFETSLKNLDSATYVFKAFDDNYLASLPYNVDSSGCVLKKAIKMIKPLPLQVYIQLKKPISCVGSNNAQLLAKASGGVVMDSVHKYVYKWYRQNSTGWDLLVATDSLLTNVSLGTYKVEILDRFNNFKASTNYTVINPIPITGTIATTPASCYSNADGTAIVSVSGGVAPYHYQWSNGDVTAQADSLVGGTYVVYITDTMGCEKILQTTITSPVSLNVNKTIKPIMCNNECNASIKLAVTGGTIPYTYTWSNGNTLDSVYNICSGTYWVKIKDNNNCIYTDTIIVDNPQAFSVSAGPDREICLNQQIRLDANVVGQNLTYQWKSISGTIIGTNPVVYISGPGTYYVAGTSTTGCKKMDTCYVTPVDENIYTEFLMSAHSFTNTNTLLVNLSKPDPVQTQWIVPTSPSIQTVSNSKDYCELKFSDTGAYNITLKVWYASGCIDELTKKVLVTSKEDFTGLGNQANALIHTLKVYPNPNAGNFVVTLGFTETTTARLRLINLITNATVDDRKIYGTDYYNENYNLNGVIPAGLYMLLVETAKGNFIYKVAKQ